MKLLWLATFVISALVISMTAEATSADAATVEACLSKTFAAAGSPCTVDPKDLFQPDSGKDAWDFSAYCGMDYQFNFTVTSQDAWNTCQIRPDAQ